jgi:hypothetical protein
MLPSLSQVKEKYAKTLRIGSFVFSDEIVPVWNGFKSINSALRYPLSMSTIKKTGNKRTALYRTMIKCLGQSANAANQANKSGDPSVPAKIKICILTDGANNLDPHDENTVKQITSQIQDKNQVQLVLAYFKTDDGLSIDQFNAMAKATGFDHKTYYFDITEGKNVDERARNFRRFFGILSDSLSRDIASM